MEVSVIPNHIERATARKAWPYSILLAGICFANGALALDHLVPPEGIASYQELVIKVFKRAFSGDVRARTIVEPSFQNEFVVGTRKIDGHYEVFYLQAQDSIWNALLNKKGNGPLLKENPDQGLTVASCAVDIPDRIAKRLERIWDAMLRQTAPDESGTVGVDGVIYYFDKMVDDKPKIAMSWSPDAKTKPGALVDIVETMRGLCAAKDKTHLDQLDRQSSALLDRLESEQRK